MCRSGPNQMIELGPWTRWAISGSASTSSRERIIRKAQSLVGLASMSGNIAVRTLDPIPVYYQNQCRVRTQGLTISSYYEIGLDY